MDSYCGDSDGMSGKFISSYMLHTLIKVLLLLLKSLLLYSPLELDSYLSYLLLLLLLQGSLFKCCLLYSDGVTDYKTNDKYRYKFKYKII